MTTPNSIFLNEVCKICKSRLQPGISGKGRTTFIQLTKKIGIGKKCPNCNSKNTRHEDAGVFSCLKCGNYWKGRGLRI